MQTFDIISFPSTIFSDFLKDYEPERKLYKIIGKNVLLLFPGLIYMK